MVAKAKTKPTERIRTFHYRRAEVVGGAPQELQSLLSAALTRKTSAKALRMHDAGDSDYVRVMYPTYTRNAMLCGMMSDYTQGSAQPIIEIDEEEETFTLKALPAAERQQFLSSLLFFGVEGDDLIVMGSRALGVGHFEEYVNWILNDATVFRGGEYLGLRPQVPKRTQAMLPKVRYLELVDDVAGASFLRTTEQNTKTSGLFGGISQGLRAAWQTQGSFREHLTVSDGLEAERLRVTVKIGLPRGRRGLQLLDEVAHVLRHTDDSLVRLKTSRGKDILDGQLRLTNDISVKMEAGIPSLFDVGKKMEEWLRQLRQDGELDGEVDV
jgi:hypothetical protein